MIPRHTRGTRMLRGSSWDFRAMQARMAYLNASGPSFRGCDLGLRLVRRAP